MGIERKKKSRGKRIGEDGDLRMLDIKKNWERKKDRLIKERIVGKMEMRYWEIIERREDIIKVRKEGKNEGWYSWIRIGKGKEIDEIEGWRFFIIGFGKVIL